MPNKINLLEHTALELYLNTSKDMFCKVLIAQLDLT